MRFGGIAGPGRLALAGAGTICFLAALAEPSLAGQPPAERSGLRMSIAEVGRDATVHSAVATYAVTVNPAGGSVRNAVLRLNTVGGGRWTDRPLGCVSGGQGDAMICLLGDLARPATLRVGVRSTARPGKATQVMVVAKADAIDIGSAAVSTMTSKIKAVTPQPRLVPRPLTSPAVKPSVMAKPALPKAVPQQVRPALPRVHAPAPPVRRAPRYGPATPSPTQSAMPPVAPAVPVAPAMPLPPVQQLPPVPQTAPPTTVAPSLPGIPAQPPNLLPAPGRAADLAIVDREALHVGGAHTWVSAIGLLLSVEALLLWVGTVFYLRRRLARR